MPRCKKLSSPILAAGLVATCAALWQPAAALAAGAAEDSREVFSGSAPGWLRAVGKLQVPGSVYRDGNLSHLQENCSATLVVGLPGRAADTIVTAWHCLENYRDLSRPIIFSLPAGTGGALQREAYRLADGGGMHADWAVLRLRHPVTPAEAGALLMHPDRADPGRTISMAGYSRDQGKGDGGDRLTFDPACRITAQAPVSSDCDCLAYKGASGGAVVQLSTGGTPQFSGVISEGDSEGFSTFVPVEAFRGALRRFLD